ncbi:MAG: thiamine-phosphate kinase [Candidatus Eisenbacteria bacterium]
MSEDPTLGELGEFEVIARLKQKIRAAAADDPTIAIDLGDDAAAYDPAPGMQQVVTTDVMVVGRHFLPGWMSAREIGARAMQVNLSDLAAMGAMPRFAFASLGLPPTLRWAELASIYDGFLGALQGAGGDVAAPRGTSQASPTILGGNLTAVAREWFLNLTLIGEVEAGRALTRSGARVGDEVWVSGCPGRSAAGLALIERFSEGASAEPIGVHLQRREAWLAAHPWGRSLLDAVIAPHARVGFGRALLRHGARAAIDLSDGLLADLTHLAEASEVRIELVGEELPAGHDPDIRELAAWLECSEGDLAHRLLGPSDDYELAFSAPPTTAHAIVEELSHAGGLPLRRIGRVVDGSGVSVSGFDSSTLRGWDHFRR